MRYIPLTQSDKTAMLKTIGAESVDELFSGIPEEARFERTLAIPSSLTEPELLEYFGGLADMNKAGVLRKNFLGAGAYAHHVPSAVDQLLLRGEIFTAYTPYQPEVSQGTLMAIYEFQTYTSALLGMDIANASMYDGASSLAEAVIMANRINKRKKIVMSQFLHPNWRDVAKAYTANMDLQIVTVKGGGDGKTSASSLIEVCDNETSAVVVQYPNFVGCVEDLEAVRDICDKTGALMIVAVAEPVAMGALESPGAFGADIVVGEGRSFGGSLSYGGPALGLFSTRNKWSRQTPGRLVGKTKDVNGKDGYTLTLATREQHIRRERATSNICSNQALCATAAAIHISLLGKNGLRKLSLRNMMSAKYLAEKISSINGFELCFDTPFFNEVAVKAPIDSETVNKKLAKHGIVGGFNLAKVLPSHKNALLFCATEVHSKVDIDNLASALSEISGGN